jgi:hypothetical protein
LESLKEIATAERLGMDMSDSSEFFSVARAAQALAPRVAPSLI